MKNIITPRYRTFQYKSTHFYRPGLKSACKTEGRSFQVVTSLFLPGGTEIS
jgi:hypothetical protein